MPVSSSRPMPSIYRPSQVPSRRYTPTYYPSPISIDTHKKQKESQPQVVQSQSTFGEYIKQGFGTYFGWRIGTAIFGSESNSNHEHNIPKSETYIINTSSTNKLDKCEDYRELLDKCLKNGGDWNGGDCCKFVELVKKCEKGEK
jgi:hypothetical protein